MAFLPSVKISIAVSLVLFHHLNGGRHLIGVQSASIVLIGGSKWAPWNPSGGTLGLMKARLGLSAKWLLSWHGGSSSRRKLAAGLSH